MSNSFRPGRYTEHIDVRDFIQTNYTPYEGGPEFFGAALRRVPRR